MQGSIQVSTWSELHRGEGGGQGYGGGVIYGRCKGGMQGGKILCAVQPLVRKRHVISLKKATKRRRVLSIALCGIQRVPGVVRCMTRRHGECVLGKQVWIGRGKTSIGGPKRPDCTGLQVLCGVLGWGWGWGRGTKPYLLCPHLPAAAWDSTMRMMMSRAVPNSQK